MRPDRIRDQGLAELGVQGRLQQISHNPYGGLRPYEERIKLLDDYKAELKKLRTKTALECHPDRTADLPEDEQKEKSERMVRINRAVDYVMSLKPRPPAPPMQPFRVVIVSTGNGFGGSATTTSTNVTGASYSWSNITAGFPFKNGV